MFEPLPHDTTTRCSSPNSEESPAGPVARVKDDAGGGGWRFGYDIGGGTGKLLINID